jgi:hypothetical protein
MGRCWWQQGIYPTYSRHLHSCQRPGNSLQRIVNSLKRPVLIGDDRLTRGTVFNFIYKRNTDTFSSLQMECYSLHTISITIICLAGVLFIPIFYRSTLSALKSGLLHGFTRHNTKPVDSSLFSVEAAFRSFHGYASATKSEIQNVRSKFNTLRGGHRRMAVDLGYQQKIERMERAHRANQLITDGISSLAMKEFPHLAQLAIPSGQRNSSGYTVSTMKVRESLKHMVRDWSEEGKREREAIYAPILSQLVQIPIEERKKHKVLVPGSGLGRLAWEIASLGQKRFPYSHLSPYLTLYRF